MKAVTKILAGAAVFAVAAGGFAAPAAAQYYPGYGYGTGNVVGQVIESILGAQRYGQGAYGYANDRMQIDRCASAVEQRINRDYGYRYGSPYGNPYGGYGAYGQSQGGAKVVNITRVERRSSSTTRVRGVATAQAAYGGYNTPYGGAYGNPYGGGYGYNQPGELTFKCDIDYRGHIRDIDIDRNNYAYGYRRY